MVAGGNGSGSGATLINTLSEAGEATRVDTVAELTIAGPLAAFVGASVIQDIANRLLRDFATCLATRLNAPSTADVATGKASPRNSSPRLPTRTRKPPRDGDDRGICGGDVPPLIGAILTGTGLTLPQAAALVAQGEDLPSLTPVQRRIVEDYATHL